MSAEELRAKIREIPDFPKPGILFYDITTLLKDRGGVQGGDRPDARALPGREDRHRRRHGVARLHLQLADGLPARTPGLVPVRKLGKLPAETITVEYALEYGSNTLEIHRDAIEPGQKVLIVDDLLATGGTVKGTIELDRAAQGRRRRARRSSSSSTSSRAATGSTAGASRASSSTESGRRPAVARPDPTAARPHWPTRSAIPTRRRPTGDADGRRRPAGAPTRRRGRPTRPPTARPTSPGAASSASSRAS